MKKGTGGDCSTCTDRRTERKTAPLALCKRCGYPTRGFVLCADCRDSLTVAERELWA